VFNIHSCEYVQICLSSLLSVFMDLAGLYGWFTRWGGFKQLTQQHWYVLSFVSSSLSLSNSNAADLACCDGWFTGGVILNELRQQCWYVLWLLTSLITTTDDKTLLAAFDVREPPSYSLSWKRTSRSGDVSRLFHLLLQFLTADPRSRSCLFLFSRLLGGRRNPLPRIGIRAHGGRTHPY